MPQPRGPRELMNSFPSSLAAEFLTWIKLSLKPTPNTVHYILTHFKGMWTIVNKIPFLRNAIMKYVLTCKSQSFQRFFFHFLKEQCMYFVNAG